MTTQLISVWLLKEDFLRSYSRIKLKKVSENMHGFLLAEERGFRYKEVHFHIFYCNSAGLSIVVHYNRVFVTAGFVIAGCHCIPHI